jgi:ferredoxin
MSISTLAAPYGSTSFFLSLRLSMSQEVRIDQKECMGCEACVEICPEIFGFDIDEGKAYVIESEEEFDEDCIEEALGSCPAECIGYE